MAERSRQLDRKPQRAGRRACAHLPERCQLGVAHSGQRTERFARGVDQHAQLLLRRLGRQAAGDLQFVPGLEIEVDAGH